MAADAPVRIRERSERQTISVFRLLLEASGGEADCRQHRLEFDYTIGQNASICARFLDVSCSRPRNVQLDVSTQRKCKTRFQNPEFFDGVSPPAIPDILEWSFFLMYSVPIGFPDNLLVQCYQS